MEDMFSLALRVTVSSPERSRLSSRMYSNYVIREMVKNIRGFRDLKESRLVIREWGPSPPPPTHLSFRVGGGGGRLNTKGLYI